MFTPTFAASAPFDPEHLAAEITDGPLAEYLSDDLLAYAATLTADDLRRVGWLAVDSDDYWEAYYSTLALALAEYRKRAVIAGLTEERS